MSHFFTVVLVPKDTNDIEGKVKELLAPYSENEKVDEYDHKCYCVNSEASKAGKELAEINVGTIESFRLSFWDKVNTELAKQGISSTNPNYWEEQEKISAKLNWEDYISAFLNYEKEATAKHHMFNKPSLTCEECKGTGLYKSTYNPASKWDWWVVGGRWDGVIKNNPQNSENGFNFDAKHRTIDNNVILAIDYLENCKTGKSDFPYSIVIPTGEWCEKGEMGWFGMSSNEKSNWTVRAEKILEQYKDCFVIGCDLHI